MDKSRRPEVFYKKSVLRNFAKFTGKHMCQSLFFNKVAGTLLKKGLWHRRFLVNFAKFLRTSFYIEHFWCLLLYGKYSNSTKDSSLWILLFSLSLTTLIGICKTQLVLFEIFPCKEKEENLKKKRVKLIIRCYLRILWNN